MGEPVPGYGWRRGGNVTAARAPTTLTEEVDGIASGRPGRRHNTAELGCGNSALATPVPTSSEVSESFLVAPANKEGRVHRREVNRLNEAYVRGFS